MHISEARAQLRELYTVLKEIQEKDPEQEVRGMAISVLDTVIEGVKPHLVDSEVARAISGVISVEAVANGEPIRAVDALLAVTALKTALGEPVPIPVSIPRDPAWPNILTMDF